MTANNARVWDTYNQERPDEPNAVACTSYDRPVTYDHNPRWNAMATAQSVAEDIWRDVRECDPGEFELTVEMPDGSMWTTIVGIEYEPSINVRSASRVARRVFALGRHDFGSGVKQSNGQSASNDWPVWDGSHGCSPARVWVTINPPAETRATRGAS